MILKKTFSDKYLKDGRQVQVLKKLSDGWFVEVPGGDDEDWPGDFGFKVDELYDSLEDIKNKKKSL